MKRNKAPTLAEIEREPYLYCELPPNLKTRKATLAAAIGIFSRNGPHKISFWDLSSTFADDPTFWIEVIQKCKHPLLVLTYVPQDLFTDENYIEIAKKLNISDKSITTPPFPPRFSLCWIELLTFESVEELLTSSNSIVRKITKKIIEASKNININEAKRIKSEEFTSDLQRRLFRYALNFAKQSEKRGEGTQYPTLSHLSEKFKCEIETIEEEVESYSGRRYMGIAVGESISGGVYEYQSEGECLLEAY